MVVDALQGQLDRYARERLDSQRIDREGRIPPEVLHDLGALGLLGLTLPEEHGGVGLPLLEACDVVRALAFHDRSVATTLGLHLGLGTRGLVAFGTPAQKAEWIPRLAEGTLAAFAATEPGAGSDLSAVSTRALPEGDTLRVDGTKAYVTNGALMGVLTALAVTPGLGGRRGHGLVLLSRDDAGLSVGPEEKKLGLRGSSTTPIYLDNVRVGIDRVIGEPGQGMQQAEHVLSWGRTLMSSGCLGTADAALALATAHVRQRQQFRRPLAALPVVRAQFAGALALLRAMEAAVKLAAVAADDLADPRQVRASMVAKVLASDGAWEICDLAVQLHGGLGFVEESGLPLLLRDSRVTRIFEGANDVLLVRLGAMEATSPTESVGDPLDAPVAKLRAELLAAYGVGLLRRHQDLHRLGRAVLARDSVRALADDSSDLAALWRLRAEERVRATTLALDPRAEDVAARHLDVAP